MQRKTCGHSWAKWTNKSFISLDGRYKSSNGTAIIAIVVDAEQKPIRMDLIEPRSVRNAAKSLIHD